ncbi:Homeodomain-like protein [Lentinula aff. detonsa]|nr:Homeodomain-like protein [Lentinula aff. detonsa]
MPRKPKIIPIRRHYSSDLKRRVIHQRFTLGKTSAAIAVDLDMPWRVVQRVLQTWKDIGDICRERQGKGKRQALGRNHCKLLVGLLEHSPDIYLDELQLELSVQHGLNVSLSTIYRNLTCLGYSSKKLSKQAAERLQHKVATFIMQIKEIVGFITLRELRSCV